MAMVLALVGAVLAGTGVSFQQRAANAEDAHGVMDPRLVIRLLRRRTWLIGITVAIAGFVVQASAISSGHLVEVEPILASSVLWALLISARHARRRLGRQEWRGIAATIIGAAGFLAVAAPDELTSGREAIPWSVPLGLLAAIAVLGVLVSRRLAPDRRGLVLACVAGVGFGTADGLIKLISDVVDADGAAGLLSHWVLWSFLVVSPLAFLAQQSAFHATHLGGALPGTTALQPPVAVILGAVMFGEQIRGGWAIPLELALAAIALVGVVLLSSSPLIESDG